MHLFTNDKYARWCRNRRWNNKYQDIFIHIPKTSGTSVIESLKKKYPEGYVHAIVPVLNSVSATAQTLEHQDITAICHKINWSHEKVKQKCSKEIGCSHHPTIDTLQKLINLYNIPDYSFLRKRLRFYTIVRDPYRRLFSALIYNNLWYPEDGNIISQQALEEFLDTPPNILHNHNLPQYKFLETNNRHYEYNTNIFKLESQGLFWRRLGLSETKSNYKKEYIGTDYMRYLDQKTITMINKYYKKDFLTFNYKML